MLRIKKIPGQKVGEFCFQTVLLEGRLPFGIGSHAGLTVFV